MLGLVTFVTVVTSGMVQSHAELTMTSNWIAMWNLLAIGILSAFSPGNHSPQREKMYWEGIYSAAFTSRLVQVLSPPHGRLSHLSRLPQSPNEGRGQKGMQTEKGNQAFDALRNLSSEHSRLDSTRAGAGVSVTP